MDWLTTSTLLDRLRDFDDRAVWDRFMQRFRRPLLSFARKLSLPAELAEDTVQEILLAFIDGYRRNQYARDRGRLSHWLFGIAYRQIAGARRRLARNEARREVGVGAHSFWRELPDESEARQTWDEEWEASMIAACLRQVRAEVSPTTYSAFELVVCEERTADEAAARLGLTRGAVYVAKHRILKRLEALMKDYEELRPGQ